LFKDLFIEKLSYLKVEGRSAMIVSIKFYAYFMLNLTRDIQSLSNFKRETQKFLAQMKKTKAPIVLTLNGKAEIVVQSATGYQALLDRLDELETREAIRVGLQEIAEGKTVPAIPALAELQQRLEQELRK
jgi:PHD/YefM family antitoxin component YafN of YafNO toxin-antitoxin module